MTDATGARRRIAVVTVHGTNDTARDSNGGKWFQNGSAFVHRLKERLARNGLDTDVHPHLWSGSNSASAREQASRALVKRIKQLANAYDGVHVVGHSHGGNVANDAACMLNWSQRRNRSLLSSITTVGTPFFRTQITAGEWFGGYGFGAMAVLSTLLLLFSAYAYTTSPNGTTATPELSSFGLFVLVVAAIGFVALIFIFPVAFQGLARIRRASRRFSTRAAILSIWHRQDEAISFLERVETLPLNPLPPGSLFRGSRTGAILLGVRGVFLLPVLGVLILADDALMRSLGLSTGVLTTPLELIFSTPNWIIFANTLLIFGVAGAPIVFAVGYLGYRLFALTVLELGLRSPLNRLVGGSLRGLAFGRDGDNRIGQVAPRSHYFGCQAYVLEGSVADRMSAAAADAARRLFDRYRGGLFEVGGGQNEIFEQIASNALTWDALIHTTYFDQPEIAEVIADHVSSVALDRPDLLPAGVEQFSAPPTKEMASLARRITRGVGTFVRTLVAAPAALLVVGGLMMIGGPALNHDELASTRAPLAPLPASLVVGQAFRDCDQCPDLVVLPGGTFIMGSPTTEPGRTSEEGPLRQLTIRRFAVGRYEVTRSQWAACVSAGGCPGLRQETPEHQVPAATMIAPGDSDHRPVSAVSWDDAQAYARWLSQRTSHRYRLLSEGEWEYAARAGTTTRYSWGNEDPVCEQSARNGANWAACPELMPVGSFQPNAFGLYDMHGNAWEWVEDCWHATYSGAPTDGSAWTASNRCVTPIIRGGSYSFPSPPRSALRGTSVRDSRNCGDCGFRVARTLD